jgi:hypothetical protein
MFCCTYICLLRRLGAAAEQQNNLSARLLEIDPIARTIIDAHFTDALANRLHITHIAEWQSINPDLNACNCSNIIQSAKPLQENVRLFDFKHAVYFNIQLGHVKRRKSNYNLLFTARSCCEARPGQSTLLQVCATRWSLPADHLPRLRGRLACLTLDWQCTLGSLTPYSIDWFDQPNS